MGRTSLIALCLIAMIALIVGLDIAFLRNHFALRLVVNIAIVAVFGILYAVFRHHL